VRLYNHDVQDFQNGSDDNRGARGSAFGALLQGRRLRGRCEPSPAVAEGLGVAGSGQDLDSLATGWGLPKEKPPPVVYARFTEQRPNYIHQADVLFLPHDKVSSRTYKYALTLVDVASRYKAARPLIDKSAAAVASALADIYEEKGTPLQWPHTMMVDAGGDFKAETQWMFDKHKVTVRRARCSLGASIRVIL